MSIPEILLTEEEAKILEKLVIIEMNDAHEMDRQKEYEKLATILRKISKAL